MLKNLQLLTLLFFFTNHLTAQYNIYSYETFPANLSFQRVIETKDGGFLMASLGDCYIPDQIAIEGCIFTMFFVRTNALGDTIWTSETPYNIQLLPTLELFENKDGSFTIITTNHQTFTCDGRVVFQRGYNQIEIINLNENGQVIDDIKFPNDCNLTLRDVVGLNNSRYAIVSVFDKPFIDETALEGHLSIINKQGEILNEVTFSQERFKGANLVYRNSEELMLIYIESGNTLVLKRFDLQLNLLSEKRSLTFINSCLAQEFPDLEVKLLNNEDLGLICFEHFPNFSKTQFFRMDTSLNVLSERAYTLIDPTNFQEDSSGQIVIASTIEELLVKQTKVNYLSPMGDSLYAEIISQSEDQTPEHLVLTPENRLAIAGSINCCNYPMDIGPARSFLFLEEQDTTSVTNNLDSHISHPNISVFPNPADSYVWIQIEDDYQLSGKHTFNLYSTLGEKLLEKKIYDKVSKVSISHLPSGIYFYTLSFDGKPVLDGRVIKK